VFAWIARTRSGHEAMTWDPRVVRFVVQHTGSHFAQRAMEGGRALGSPTGQLLIASLIVLVLALSRKFSDMVFVGTIVAGAHVAIAPLKEAFGEGFPSGHALGSMTVGAAAVVIAWSTRLRWPVLLAALAFVGLVGVSRIYYTAHYPSDVLGGWALGAAWVVVGRLATHAGAWGLRRFQEGAL